MAFDFSQVYSRDRWLSFMQKNLLPEDFELRNETVSFDYSPKYLEKKAHFLGFSPKLNLSVYEMTHESEKDPRISISRDAFRFLDYHKVKNALIFFVSEKSSNYRLSLVTREISLQESRVATTFCNPKRFSYFLGPGIKKHTVEEYLLKKGRIKDEADLKTRFSIEIVNKEFYSKIADLFSQLVGGKRNSGNSVREYSAFLKLPDTTDSKTCREFAVRLIGRIVFCWFLKKKKSNNNIPLITDELLSTTAVQDHPGYYHTILEPLFFEVMNRKPEKRRDYIKENPLFMSVPFLNGGLFDYNIHKDFYVPYGEDNAQRYAFNLKIPDEWFNEFFSILELYNFTIDENTPVDMDISVDPEMLGRIFENLLAEINPETEETARKNTGSYYTPRHIVEYMVDESLISYLLTSICGLQRAEESTSVKEFEAKLRDLLDYTSEGNNLSDLENNAVSDALDELTIIDPACGSGAFPMGILQKMLLIRQKIDPESIQWVIKQLERIPEEMKKKEEEDKWMSQNWDYRYKMAAIKHSIYGVDIQTIAVEIAKLRFFLTLMVDEKVDDSEPNWGINPLPNLSFKFVAADSLTGLKDYESSTVLDWTDKLAYDECISRMEKLRERYFYATDPEFKESIQNKFKETQNELKEFLLKTGSVNSSAIQLANWEPFTDNQTEWFDSKWMFGVKEGFDIVIGNPPYIQLQNNAGDLANKYKDQGFATFARTGDIYSLFYERGVKLLKTNGVLCYISSNKWMRAKYGEATRMFFSELDPLILVDLGSNIFESATVDTNILIIRNTKTDKQKLKALDISKDKKKDNFISNPDWVNITTLSNEAWTISSQIAQRIREKIEAKGKPLKDWDINIYYGIKTGFNEAFIITTEKREEILNNCRDQDERNRTEKLLKPILRGRDIKRYKAEWAGLWLIGTHNGYINNTGVHVPPIDITDYPVLKTHLDQYYPQLTNRCDKGYTPYNLRNCAYYQDFEKEKIVYPETTQQACFFLDNQEYYYCDKTCFVITGENLGVLELILNSKASTSYFKTFCSGTKLGIMGYQYNKHALEALPIPVVSPSIINLAKNIKTAKDFGYDTTDLERQAERMVYELYCLTEEEISFVESEII